MSEAVIRFVAMVGDLAVVSCEECGLACLLTFLTVGAAAFLLCLSKRVVFSWVSVGSAVLNVRSHFANGPKSEKTLGTAPCSWLQVVLELPHGGGRNGQRIRQAQRSGAGLRQQSAHLLGRGPLLRARLMVRLLWFAWLPVGVLREEDSHQLCRN